jgi:putative ABC transport system ATP-binding protein
MMSQVTASTAAPPASAARLLDVSKVYGHGEVAVHALREVTLDISPGSFVVFLGPSGSGKTTLLNVLGGMESVSGGRITVAGEEITGYGAAQLSEYRRRRVGFVFQFFNLIPTLTAIENVELIAELTQHGRDHGQSAELLAAMGLEGRMDHFPSALSGGEQQRIAVARALAKKPDMLLCDEPTGALDLATGRGVLALLRDANLQRGVTVLVVSHNAAIARMADRVIRMRSGQVVDDVRNASPAAARELDW